MNLKNLKPGREHADPDTPGLHFAVAVNGVTTLICRYTDGEYDYGEILGFFGEVTIQSARAHVRRLSTSYCPI